MNEITIRRAGPADMAAVHTLIHELAVYEKLPDEVDTDPSILERDGFGDRSWFECMVAETGDKVIVGAAVYYLGYSTWKGKIIYLDDLIVNQAYRRLGVGKLFFDKLVARSLEVNARQLRWHVLDWNEPAIRFYEKIEADLDTTWTTCRLSRQQLELWK